MTLRLRTRLTLWYTAVLSLALLLCAGLFYLLHTRGRLAQVDAELARAEALVGHAVTAELEEGANLAEAAEEALADVAMPGLSLAILSAEGGLVAGSGDAIAPTVQARVQTAGHGSGAGAFARSL